MIWAAKLIYFIKIQWRMYLTCNTTEKFGRLPTLI